MALLVLFLLPFPFPDPAVRTFFTIVYLAIAAVLLVQRRRCLAPTFRSIGSWRNERELPQQPSSAATS